MESKPINIAYPKDDMILPPEKTWEEVGGKDFRTSYTQVPINPALVITDSKMAKKFDEDILYEKRALYVYNMRRGMSFLMDVKKCDPKLLEKTQEKKDAEEGDDEEALTSKAKRKKDKKAKKAEHQAEEAAKISGEEDKKSEETKQKIKKKGVIPVPEEKIPDVFMIARRGLEKFFDVVPAHFEDPFKLPNDDNKANYIFYPAQKQIEQGYKIELYASRKANGENAQVAYLPSLGYWVIGSKNVSMPIRDEKDLEIYSKYFS